MSLKEVVVKNNIPINTLEDDSLVNLFRELEKHTSDEKTMLQNILKTLLERKKLFLLTRGT